MLSLLTDPDAMSRALHWRAAIALIRPMPITPERLDALRRFAQCHLEEIDLHIEPASADASFRSYWRVGSRVGSHVVMNAPPEREPLGPWLDVAQRLRAAGLHAPEVLATDLTQGFLLLEDLGTRTYLPELDETTVHALYGKALAALYAMQTRVDTTGLPAYDAARLQAEMDLLPEWFLARHLGRTLDPDERAVLERAFALLIDAALGQPQVFVHRDFHSRNLLVAAENSPAIIDFQDAVRGPPSYDLVSLLRDCYIAWPKEQVYAWVDAHHARLVAAGIVDADAARFRRGFDLMGLQRHIKVLGIFCRLWYRDGKAQYLGDLPLTLRYALDVAHRYPELRDFATLLDAATAGRDLTRPRAAVLAVP